MTSRTTAAFERHSLRRAVALINGKGGTLKTSLTGNLAGLFAEGDMRVLAVDLDPQGNLAEDLGYGADDRADEGLGLLEAVVAGRGLDPVRDVRPNLDVVPGGEHLTELAVMLQSRRQRDPSAVTAFARSLAQVAGDYDLVLVDCPPGEEALQDAALAAVRWALIPARTDASSRKGLRRVAARFETAYAYNPQLELLGVVLTGVTKGATRVHQRARDAIAEDLGHNAAMVFDATIRYVEAAATDGRESGRLAVELERDGRSAQPWWQALRTGIPVDRVASSAPGLAGDYQALAEEFVGRLLDAESVGSAPLEGVTS